MADLPGKTKDSDLFEMRSIRWVLGTFQLLHVCYRFIWLQNEHVSLVLEIWKSHANEFVHFLSVSVYLCNLVCIESNR